MSASTQDSTSSTSEALPDILRDTIVRELMDSLFDLYRSTQNDVPRTKAEDVGTFARDYPNVDARPSFVGQVGLACRHCKTKITNLIAYPRSVSALVSSAHFMIHEHFDRECAAPEGLKEKLKAVGSEAVGDDDDEMRRYWNRVAVDNGFADSVVVGSGEGKGVFWPEPNDGGEDGEERHKLSRNDTPSLMGDSSVQETPSNSCSEEDDSPTTCPTPTAKRTNKGCRAVQRIPFLSSKHSLRPKRAVPRKLRKRYPRRRVGEP